MPDAISLVISSLALAVSGITAWATLLRGGKLLMTQPTIVYFGPDGTCPESGSPPQKLFLRTLFFSTGKRGRMIESMHARITRNETVQNLNIWVYGEDKLVRGSGLFVGETGVVANHHFLAPKDGNAFGFSEGVQKVELFARVRGDKRDSLIWSHQFLITKDQEEKLRTGTIGLYFDWAPNSQSYIGHLDERPPRPPKPDALEFFRSFVEDESKSRDML